MPQIGDIKRGRHTYIWHACEGCGKERWVNKQCLSKGTSRHCHKCAVTNEFRQLQSELHRGEKHWNWKGGIAKTHHGYIQIKLRPDNFFYPMVNNKDYVREHRLVMAKHLGRNLQRWELVHHKGVRFKGIQNRSDNLIDNLQLISDTRHDQITLLEKRIKFLENCVAKLEVKKLGAKEIEKGGE